MKNKSHVYLSYKKHGEPDTKIKQEIQDCAKKCGIKLLQGEIIEIPESGFRRPDLYSPQLNFVVESDGSWHKTKKGRKQTKQRNSEYSKLGITCAIFDPEVFSYLGVTINEYMLPIIQNYNILNDWGLEI